jgi:hypothetical protein
MRRQTARIAPRAPSPIWGFCGLATETRHPVWPWGWWPAVTETKPYCSARGRELPKRFLDGHRGASIHPGFGRDKPRVFALRTNGRNWKTGFLPTEASPRPRLRSRPPSSPRALTARGSFPRVGGAWATVSHRRKPCFEWCRAFPNGVASAGTLPRRPRTHDPLARISGGFSKIGRRPAVWVLRQPTPRRGWLRNPHRETDLLSKKVGIPLADRRLGHRQRNPRHPRLFPRTGLGPFHAGSGPPRQRNPRYPTPSPETPAGRWCG